MSFRTNRNPFQDYNAAVKNRDDPAQVKFRPYHATAVWYFRALPIAFFYTIWVLIHFNVGGPSAEARDAFVRVIRIAAVVGVLGGLAGYFNLRRLRKVSPLELSLVTASVTLTGAVFLATIGILFHLRA